MSLWDKLVDGAVDIAEAVKEKGEDFIKEIDLTSDSVRKQVNDVESANGKETIGTTSTTVSQSSINYNMLMGAGVFLIILLVLLKR